MAVDLVNTLETVGGRDDLATVDDLVSFLGSYGRDWSAEGWYCGEPGGRDLSAVIAVRESLRRVFQAASPEEASELLNTVLRDAGAQPRVSAHGAGPHLHFEPVHGHVAEWLGATLGMALAVVLVEHGFDRLGVCEASDCNDVFVDTSRNRSRTKCSTSCTTRANVAAYRERQKTSAG